jgi:hypothetical protein
MSGRNPLGRKLLLLEAGLSVMFRLGMPAAYADTGSQVGAIADTADRICGIVTTQGEASSTKVQGDIHAELNGLAKRLATIGGSGSGDITTSSYQGLLQTDLASSLRDVRQCKLQVFKTLQHTILPDSAGKLALGAPGPDLLQAPGNANTVDTTKSLDQQSNWSLYSCFNEERFITCYIVITRIAALARDYKIDESNASNIKLIDNYHIEHHLRQAYYVDGLGNRQKEVNLSTGESIWLTLQFDGGPRSISSARIVFSLYGQITQLRGAVGDLPSAQ